MKSWQRCLTVFLALLLAWLPASASHAQAEDSLRLGIAWTVEEDAFFTALSALDVYLDTEEQQAMDAVIALLNAAEVRLQLGMNGEQTRLSLMLSGSEILYFQEDVYGGRRYVTSNLFPGVAFAISQREVWDVAQALWRTDWTSLGQELGTETEAWAESLEAQYEEGVFWGDVIPSASARTRYVVEDQDLSALVDAWVDTLRSREDVAVLADTLLVEGYWDAWLDMAQDFNYQVARDNLYRYDASVLWNKTGEPVGTVIAASLRDSAQRPWMLSLGWDDRGVDALATLPLDTEDVLLRYTLSTDEQEDAQTLFQRLHVLNAAAGEGYDTAAENAAEELLMEGETRFLLTGPVQQTLYQGSATLRGAGIDLTIRQDGESSLNLQDLSMSGLSQFYLADGALLCTQTYGSELTEVAPVPDFAGLTVLTPDTLLCPEMLEALDLGLDQLTVRVFKAIPSECIDLLIQLTLALP